MTDQPTAQALRDVIDTAGARALDRDPNTPSLPLTKEQGQAFQQAAKYIGELEQKVESQREIIRAQARVSADTLEQLAGAVGPGTGDNVEGFDQDLLAHAMVIAVRVKRYESELEKLGRLPALVRVQLAVAPLLREGSNGKVDAVAHIVVPDPRVDRAPWIEVRHVYDLDGRDDILAEQFADVDFDFLSTDHEGL